MNKTDKESILHNLYIIIISLIVITVCITSLYRTNFFSFLKPRTKISYSLSKKWLDSLENNNFRETVMTASRIVKKSEPYVPSPTYYYLAINAGININFFNPPFTKLDYDYWLNSLKVNKLYKRLKSDNNTAKHIFLQINDQVKTIKTDNNNIFSYETWNNKKGTLLEKYILLSDILLQGGYNTQIVSLHEYPNSKPVHILAEIYDKNNIFFTCDFTTNSFWNNSLSNLEESGSKLNFWPAKWKKGLSYKLYKTEASALSYRKINMQLYKALSDINSNIPIFGIDPESRVKKFMKHVKYVPEHCSFLLGIEPFLLIKRSKFFKKKWIKRKTNFKLAYPQKH
ncbi:MAG TPA: hypothetical protein QF753_12660 [Victivallales bacterium]|nr:hypothetical protein [Victivallales bacterium]